MIGLRYDTVKGKTHAAGIISNSEGNIPITDISVNTEFEEGTIRKPIRATTKVTDATGRTFTLHSECIHPNVFARYARQFKGGETELFEILVTHDCEEIQQRGTGLAEWLFTYKR